MADPSCRNVDIFEDDDPTEELQIVMGTLPRSTAPCCP